MMIYLCHKCSGLLTACDDKGLYGCGCISGYIRDWQKPVSLETAIAEQVSHSVERLDLYRRQRRGDRSDIVAYTRANLAILLNDPD